MPKKNNKTLIRSYIIVGIILYVIVCYFVLHYYIMIMKHPRYGFEELASAALNSMFMDPLAIFPLPLVPLQWILIASFALAVCGWMMYSSRQMKKHDNPDTVNGDAHFMDEAEEKEYNKRFSDPPGSVAHDGPYNMIISRDIMLNMDNRATRRNLNALVIGGSGAGKSRFFVGPNILQANCNFVITDPSGELLSDYGKFLENNGYKVKVFNLVDTYSSSRYNPFFYIRSEKDVFILVNTLIKNTTPEGKGGGDPFWEKSETALLSALILYLWSEYPKEQQTFSNVMKLLYMADVDENDSTSKSPLDILFDDLEERDPENLAIQQYKVFKMGAGKTLKSILISVGVRLNTFNLRDVKHLTSTDDLELDKFADSKQALFVIIPTAENTFNFLVSLMYSQLFMSLYDYVETRAEYGWQIVLPNRDVVKVEQAATRDESPKAKKRIDKFFNNLQKDLKVVYNKERKYYEIRTANDEIISWRGTEAQANEYICSLSEAKVMKTQRRLPVHVRMLLDEFANIGQIPDFNEKLATIRKYELSCAIILQSLAQIKAMYEKQWETIVGNCDVKLYLGGNDFGTAEWISKTLGKRTTKTQNTSFQAGNAGGSTSINSGSVELMAPNQILGINDDECIFMMRPYNYYGRKYEITEHPRYKEAMSTKGEFTIPTAGEKPQRRLRRAEIIEQEQKMRAEEKENIISSTNQITESDTITASVPNDIIKNEEASETASSSIASTASRVDDSNSRKRKNKYIKKMAKDAETNLDSSTGNPVIGDIVDVTEDSVKDMFNCESENEFAALVESVDSRISMCDENFGPDEMFFESTD